MPSVGNCCASIATARLSKRLALLDHDAPIEIHKAEVAPHTVDRERLRGLFGRFEFASLLDRLVEVLPVEEGVGSEPAPAEATELQVRDVDLRALETAVDWSLPVGLAARAGDGGERDARLAQAPGGRGRPGANAAGDGTPSVYELSDLGAGGGPLRELLRRGPRCCHDLKRAPVLAGLLDSADHDSYLAAYLLAPGRRSYDLFELAAQAGVEAVRAEGPHAGAAEAATVVALAVVQERLLRELGMWSLFEEIELPLTRVLIDMETVGIHLDCYRLGEITAKIQDQMDGLEAGIYELAQGEFNLGSAQQLGEVLFEQPGCRGRGRPRRATRPTRRRWRRCGAATRSSSSRSRPSGSCRSCYRPICWRCLRRSIRGRGVCTLRSTRSWRRPAD